MDIKTVNTLQLHRTLGFQPPQISTTARQYIKTIFKDTARIIPSLPGVMGVYTYSKFPFR